MSEQIATAVWSGHGPHPLAGQTILQIVPQLDAGGAILEITTALAEAGARPLVASAGGRLVPELQAKGGLWVPFPAQTKNPLAMALNQTKLAELLWRERVAVVHAHSRAPAWVAYGATRCTRTPFITTFHGAYSANGTFRRNYNAVMAKGDIVIAHSRFTAQHIASLYPEAADRVRPIERGLDLQAFDPQDVAAGRVLALRRAWNIASDERIVFMPAPLTARSGHKELIEAARLLTVAGVTGVKFVLVFDGDIRASLRREIEAAITKTGLDRIIARASVGLDMPAAFLAASVVAIPPTDPEASNQLAAEAQAMGTPTVVTDLGALADVIAAPPEIDISGRTGWRVPPGDAAALAAALYDVLNMGASARENLSLRARARVISRFSLRRMQAETLAAYAELVDA